MKSIILYIAFVFPFMLPGQSVFLDGQYEDWSNADLQVGDVGDHGSSTGIEALDLYYDDDRIYLRLEVSEDILLQQDNEILLAIDFDHDTGTGFDIGGIGAELVFNFGLRNGLLYHEAAILQIEHDDIGLLVAPTVSSETFEMAIPRRFTSQGLDFAMQNTVSVYMANGVDGTDQLPDAGILSFDMDEERPFRAPPYTLEPLNLSDFRLVSFNASRDNIFNAGARESVRQILGTIKADVYCLQEIYDHDADETLALLSSINVIDNAQNWFAVKHAPDLVTISRYPIIYGQNVGSNAAVVLDVNGEHILIVNAHLPCCDNETGRDIEIDQILSFIRRAKDGDAGVEIEEDMPYLFCGDMNLVGDARQLKRLKNGDILDEGFYGPDVALDWDGDGMGDVIASTTGFPASFTWYNRMSSFFPGRLDFIIYTDDALVLDNAFVLNSTGLNQAELTQFQINSSASLTASDHMPLVADFTFSDPLSTLSIAKEISVYPNPCNGAFTLKGLPVDARPDLFDLHGNRIPLIEHGLGTYLFDSPPGPYILTVFNGHQDQRSFLLLNR